MDYSSEFRLSNYNIPLSDSFLAFRNLSSSKGGIRGITVRKGKENMTEGASLKEQLLDASRRNNLDLLNSIIEKIGSNQQELQDLINNSKDPFGNTAIHLCSKHGSWDVLDTLLDQEGVDINQENTIDGDTPLHLCVRYSHEEPEHGTFIAENLIEVGADPRKRNNQGKTPLDLVHSTELEPLVNLLQGAEIAADNKGKLMNEEDAEEFDDGPEDD